MKALGIDFGDARIGLALSDDLGMMAHPLETIVRKATPNFLPAIASLVKRENVQNVVIGLPRNMDGSEGASAEKAKTFAEKLQKQVLAKVELWDERLTSVQAQRALHETGKNTKQSREVIDQVAAQIILQGWLDAQALRQQPE